MHSAGLILTLLVAACFSLTGWLLPWHQQWQGSRRDSGGLLAMLMGDSRRIFAAHFFVKADVYFHSGYYPSIFDNQASHQTPHVAADAGAMEEKNEPENGSFLGPPRDWIERFGRYFFPSQHTHLDTGGAGESERDHAQQKPGHKPGDSSDKEEGLEREILPWLRLSAEFDPHRVETYTVSAFWLRSKLGKVAEAEQFLREGLRENPDSYEILYELGRLFYENRKDVARTRNIWELALKKWRQRNSKQAEPDTFMFAQITGQLARLEEKERNFQKAVEYFELLKTVSPNRELIQQGIESLRQKLANPAAK